MLVLVGLRQDTQDMAIMHALCCGGLWKQLKGLG